METIREPQPKFSCQNHPVSALGLRLRQIREQIEAAAERGEIKLLTKQELDRELGQLRESDPNLP